MTANNYDEALRRLLLHEGGYSNHPSDPGGPTNFGITMQDFRRFVKQDATAADVQAMGLAQAKEIYRAKYWHALNCDRLPAGLDYAVFDYGVHSGVGRVPKVVRQLVGSAGAGAGIDATMIALVKARNPTDLIGKLCDERLAFLRRLKTWPAFGRGWARRVAEVRSAALMMARAGGSAPGAVTAAPPASKPVGKGIVPVNRKAQQGTTGAVIASGTVVAERAYVAGAPVGMIVVLVIATIALALGLWMFWRWRQRRAQMRVADSPNTPFVAKV